MTHNGLLVDENGYVIKNYALPFFQRVIEDIQGMCVLEDGKFDRAIHSIENAPFRTKFDKDSNTMHGNYGIGSISNRIASNKYVFTIFF